LKLHVWDVRGNEMDVKVTESFSRKTKKRRSLGELWCGWMDNIQVDIKAVE